MAIARIYLEPGEYARDAVTFDDLNYADPNTSVKELIRDKDNERVDNLSDEEVFGAAALIGDDDIENALNMQFAHSQVFEAQEVDPKLLAKWMAFDEIGHIDRFPQALWNDIVGTIETMPEEKLADFSVYGFVNTEIYQYDETHDSNLLHGELPDDTLVITPSEINRDYDDFKEIPELFKSAYMGHTMEETIEDMPEVQDIVPPSNSPQVRKDGPFPEVSYYFAMNLPDIMEAYTELTGKDADDIRMDFDEEPERLLDALGDNTFCVQDVYDIAVADQLNEGFYHFGIADHAVPTFYGNVDISDHITAADMISNVEKTAQNTEKLYDINIDHNTNTLTIGAGSTDHLVGNAIVIDSDYIKNVVIDDSIKSMDKDAVTTKKPVTLRVPAGIDVGEIDDPMITVERSYKERTAPLPSFGNSQEKEVNKNKGQDIDL